MVLTRSYGVRKKSGGLPRVTWLEATRVQHGASCKVHFLGFLSLPNWNESRVVLLITQSDLFCPILHAVANQLLMPLQIAFDLRRSRVAQQLLQPTRVASRLQIA